MSYLQAIILGIVQGLTEFLPVSSSGHLALAEMITGHETPGGLTFDVMLHIGTLFAVCVAFWSDIKAVTVEFCKMVWLLVRRKRSLREPPARRMVKLLIIALLPLPLLALPFFREAAGYTMRSPFIIGLALLVTGTLLRIADRAPQGKKTEMTTRWYDAFLIGVVQLIAGIFPGLSRSGSTISTGIMRDYNRTYAFRFSFLLSIPTVLAATVFEVYEWVTMTPDHPRYYTTPAFSGIWGQALVGIIVSAIVGYFAIALLRRLVRNKQFGAFSYYCFAVGGFAIIGAIVGLL
ncbi:MAG: undecaprenyl-diphosphate phosphatase [Oscillospiraceae bacterium]|nr:undecaprenyl-diphosphate phosphatase [Oscillospiraceae bacterium]